MARRPFFKLCLAAAMMIAAWAMPPAPTAQAALLDGLLQHKTFPLCHDEKVLKRIISRFNWTEKNTWHRGFAMNEIGRVRERLVRTSPEFLIPRRYCRAHSHMTNGTHPTLYYLIEGGQGFAGNSFHVRFCVSGLDPWRENNGSCRLIRY